MSILAPKEEDIQKMLSAQCHIGTRNSDHMMEEYIWRRRQDGIHIINDIIAISARPYGQRAVLKFAQYTGAASIAGRFTPGTFTNQITKQFKEPRILVITDPRTDSQAVKEASYVNLPVIAFCDSDSPCQHVDVAIPSNNKGKLSIGLLYWLLAREMLRMRGTVARHAPWDVPVDLFFYRDPEELEKADEAQAFAAEQEGGAQQWAGAEAPPKEQPYSEPGAMEGFAAPAAPEAGLRAADAPAAPDAALAQNWDGNAQRGLGPGRQQPDLGRQTPAPRTPKHRRVPAGPTPQRSSSHSRSTWLATAASMSSAAGKPIAVALDTSKCNGQDPTMAATCGSGTKSTRDRSPPCRSKLASISSIDTEMPGAFTQR
ncbi:hypothetical protein JL722_8128 [Aureococcus anophagefferens]|nr:hypothetical protein JL722_8128 [Aureococcus anophagefferens]